MAFWTGFRATLAAAYRGVARWVLGPGAALLLVLLGLAVLVFVGKMIPLGQVFDWLLGRSKRPGELVTDVVVANTPPPNRVRDGKPILPGEADQKGQTQAVVVPLLEPNLFDRSDQVKYIPPGADKPVLVDLPEGVRSRDVQAIVVVAPKIVAVQVTSSSAIAPKTVDDLVRRYGG